MATILIADDRPLNRQYLASLLGFFGHRIVEAADGEEALALAKTNRPGLVITDLVMPRADGHEFARRMRLDPDLAQVPVIFYSATYSLQQACSVAKEVGAFGVLPKPSGPEEVLKMVNQALGLPAWKPEEASAPSAFPPFIPVAEALPKGLTDLGTHADRLAATVELSLELASQSDPEGILQLLAHTVRKLIGSRQATVTLCNENAAGRRLFFSSGARLVRDQGPLADRAGAPRLSPTPRSGSLLGTLIERHRARRACKVQASELGVDVAEWQAGLVLESVLAAPLEYSDILLGWLLLLDKLGAAEFSAEDERIASTLASLGAVAYQRLSGRRKAEEELRKTKSMFESLFESAPDALLATDRGGLIKQVNARAERMFGYDRSELVGQTIEVLVPKRLRRKHHGLREGYYAEPRQRPMEAGLELCGRRKDGAEVPIEISLSPIETGEGTLVISAIRDVSERRKAEEARSHLQALVESSDDAIIGQTPEHVIVSWNAGAEAMYGYTAAEMIGRPISVIASPEQQQQQAAFAGKVVRGEGIQRYEAVRMRKDGSLVPVSVTTSPIKNTSGKLLGVSSICRDITEQKALEDQLRRKNVELEEQNRMVQEATRLKSEFLASMSHELRTPLNAIIGFTELMHHEKVGPVSALQKEYLGDVLSSSRHLLQLINDILDLSKVEAGKMEFQPEPADLGGLVESVRTTLRTLAAARRIRVDTEIDPGVTGVVIDTGKFKQVLYNFVSNALKFTPEEGRLCIRIRPEGTTCFRLEVEDNGIGILPENIPMLFTEFRQLSSGAGKKYAGTGLGLALTKRIVEAQGGTVGVSSTPGKGSVFHAVLPLVAGIVPPEEYAATSAPGPPEAGGPRVLVVEDNAGEREWLARTLAGAGYTVETASTGAQALDRCRCRAFDAITLDLLLPDMSGWDVLGAVRSEPLNQAPLVVVVTVAAERGKGIGFAVHDLLVKPISAQDLLASLKRAPAAGGSETVLVVDDDPRDLKLAAELLRQAGYRPVCKLDGESALRAAAEEQPAAVILDLQIPGMDGFEFLHRFRSEPSGRNVPVIVWTHNDVSAQQRATIQRSAQALVAKGAGGATLIEQLRAHLPGTRGLDALARMNETEPVKETAPEASTSALSEPGKS